MNIFRIYASISDDAHICTVCGDFGPAEAMEKAKGNEWVAWQLTESAYAERVEEVA